MVRIGNKIDGGMVMAKDVDAGRCIWQLHSK